MGFREDIQIGKAAQIHLEQQLYKIGFTNISHNDNADYDLLADEITIEVKYDKYEAKSGNIAIETDNVKSKKPSGISSTKADFWCHILQKDDEYVIYLTRTNNLKQFIDKNKPHRTIECGGDGNAKLLLFKSDIIIPAIFTLLTEYTNKEELLNGRKSTAKKE